MGDEKEGGRGADLPRSLHQEDVISPNLLRRQLSEYCYILWVQSRLHPRAYKLVARYLHR
jgi:hypothetical protein